MSNTDKYCIYIHKGKLQVSPLNDRVVYIGSKEDCEKYTKCIDCGSELTEKEFNNNAVGWGGTHCNKCKTNDI